MAMVDALWTPSKQRIERTHLHRFMRTSPGAPSTYQDLWEWSTDDLAGFWAKVWADCEVIASQGYTQVHGEPRMPGTDWFTGARLSFAENLLRRRDDHVALIGAGEGRDDEVVTYAELYRRVARAQHGLVGLGVGIGDRVAGFLPNCVETVVLALATWALGAVWSSCSPDFGPMGVVDRFGQIRPKVLAVADGYRYNGATHSLGAKIDAVLERIDGTEHVVVVDFAETGAQIGHRSVVPFEALLDQRADQVEFVQTPPDHPLAVLYSSGTTGAPKSIVHGVAGTLVTHLKEHRLHVDLYPGDVLFWFTTCGWMMWNWLLSALASEVTIVLYDGSPTYPGPDVLWRLAERAGVTHFGTSPRFLSACARAGLAPSTVADLGPLRAVLSTGSPLSPEQFDWVYANVRSDLQLASISGGTDLIGCFAGGVPILPVRRGELQARALGMAVQAWDADGTPVVGERGELVCTRPFPSMPIGFWGDEDGSRYRDAYFAEHPGVWTHGDFIEIRPSGGVVIYGRSDTTLNPGGVRIGTAEIYRAVDGLPEVADSIVVARPVPGDVEVVLCVQLADEVELDEGLDRKIRTTIRERTTPRHVPRHIFAVPAVPYTINGKKVEKAVLAAINGEPVDNRDALANPDALDAYAELPFPD
ncbi:MAG: acetoacetate--CoA ligase [Egibacteraceae bacterium]